MLARRVAKGLVANSQRQSARFLSTAAAGDWVVSPAAGTLLAGNPSIDIKALAAKCAAHSPGSGKVIITKVRSSSCLASNPLIIYVWSNIRNAPASFLQRMVEPICDNTG